MKSIIKLPVLSVDDEGIFIRTFDRYSGVLCVGKTDGKGMNLIAITKDEEVKNKLKNFRDGAEEINEIPPDMNYNFSGNQDLLDS